MPTYDYQCAACGHRFEKFQSITARAITKCPKCERRKVKRLIGMGAGVIFKGSGFYATDYRSKSYTKEAEKDKASSKGDDKSAGAKDGKEKAGPKTPEATKEPSE